MTDTPKRSGSGTIRYRIESSADEESVQDRRVHYQEFIEEMLAHGSSTELMDTLLIFANICETAPYRHAQSREQMRWNAACAYSLRQVLSALTSMTEHGPKPNIELEDHTLYRIQQQFLH